MVSRYKNVFMNDTLPGDLMVNKENHDYMCQICLFIPNPDTAMEHKICKRVYCRSCITSWFKKNSCCPNCMKEITNSKDEFPPVSASNFEKYVMIKSQLCRCPTILSISGEAGSSCTWQGTLDAIHNHLNNCLFIFYPCKWGCGQQFNNETLNKHETEECSLRIVKCQFCEIAIKFVSLKSHLSEECKKNPDMIVNCEFKEMGCPYRGKRSSLEKHNEENMKKHLECIVWKIEMQKQVLKEKNIIIENITERKPKEISASTYPQVSPLSFLKPLPSYSAISNEIDEELLLFKTKNKHFLKCRKGHDMEGSVANAIFVCNGCGKKCDKGQYNWNCLSCGFVICADCSVLSYPKETLPYLFSYCPYCPPEKSILIKRPAEACRFFPPCHGCQGTSPKIRYYCAYCNFSVCEDCQIVLSQ